MDVKKVQSAECRVQSADNVYSRPSSILVKAILIFVGFMLAGCGGQGAKGIVRIGLLGPFEGRYRDVGYEAYYAARLAIHDTGNTQIELFAVDDGGTSTRAASRARALVLDPTVVGVVALGYAATDAETQLAFGDLPVIIAGNWGTTRESETVYLLAGTNIQNALTIPPRVSLTEVATLEAPLVGDEIFALESFRELRGDLSGITVVSNAALPDETFREQYINSAQFTPEPGLIAVSTYEAVNHILTSIAQAGLAVGRADLKALLDASFSDGSSTSATSHFYAYDETGHLFAVDRPVE